MGSVESVPRSGASQGDGRLSNALQVFQGEGAALMTNTARGGGGIPWLPPASSSL